MNTLKNNQYVNNDEKKQEPYLNIENLNSNTIMDKKTIGPIIDQLTFDFYKPLEAKNSIFNSFSEKLSLIGISPKINFKDKFVKFKNMIAYSLIKNSDYIKNNDNANLWHNLSYKRESVVNENKQDNSLLLATINAFSSIAQQAGVAISVSKSNIINTTTSFIQGALGFKANISLIGEKKKVVNLQNKFGEILSSLGFNSNELHHDTIKNNYIDKDTIIEEVEKELEVFKFTKENGKFLNDFLSNLADEDKASTIYSILWPALGKKINESMKLTAEISSFIKANKYLKMLDDFSLTNGMKTEDVSNILMLDKNSTETIFKDKKGILNIKKNYSDIMENVNKFTELANNNQIRLRAFIQASEDLKEIIGNLQMDAKKKEQLIEAINKTVVFNDVKQNKAYCYEIIKKNADLLNNINKKSRKP